MHWIVNGLHERERTAPFARRRPSRNRRKPRLEASPGSRKTATVAPSLGPERKLLPLPDPAHSALRS